MKKSFKQIVSVFIIAILVLSIFNGCRKSDDKDGSSTNSTSGTKNSVDNSYKPDFKGKKIKIACWTDVVSPKLGVSDLGDAQYYAYEYAKKRDNAQIEWVFLPESEYYTKFTQTASAGSTFADIMTVHSNYHASWAGQDLLSDLTEYMKDEDQTHWNLNRSLFKDKIYGMDPYPPYNWAPYFLLYNKDLISTLNLESPDSLVKKGEWTWDKFRSYCKAAVKDTNSDGITDRFGMSAFWLTDLARFSNGALPYTFADGKYFNANTHATTKQSVLNALNFISDMATKDKSIMGTQTGGIDAKNSATEAFKNNNLLFMASEFAGAKDLKSQGATNFAPVLFPKGADAKEFNFIEQGYSFWAIPKNTDFPAKDLVSFWKDSQNTWDSDRDNAYYYSSAESEVQRVAAEYFNSVEETQSLYDQCKEIKTKSILYGSLNIGSIDVWDINAPILEGKSTPATVLSATDGKIQAAIDTVLNAKK